MSNQRNNDTEIIRGDPSKGFFVSMITRDIDLDECILDLVDNCVDGAIRTISRNGTTVDDRDYSKFFVKILFNKDHFSIQDNCGGIPIGTAKKYAFRFGKPDDAPKDPVHSIGLYGIGMKRALFKMCNQFLISSSTSDGSFDVNVDIPKWRKEKAWDFVMSNIKYNLKKKGKGGTLIVANNLHDGISRSFEDPIFLKLLFTSIQRDYAYILKLGLTIFVNEHKVRSKIPTLKLGKDLAPLRISKKIRGVDIEITAGLGASPPADDSPGANLPEGDYYGWYVVCNDRVVLSADRSRLTGWGQSLSGIPSWHPQYLGFIGVVRFNANDPKKLPWTTTKRGIDYDDPVYQSALSIMNDATRQFIDYTNKRSGQIKEVKTAERAAKSVAIWDVPKRKTLKVPKSVTVYTTKIQFTKPDSEIQKLGKALGIRRVSGKSVGQAAFDYAYKREVEE